MIPSERGEDEPEIDWNVSAMRISSEIQWSREGGCLLPLRARVGPLLEEYAAN